MVMLYHFVYPLVTFWFLNSSSQSAEVEEEEKKKQVRVAKSVKVPIRPLQKDKELHDETFAAIFLLFVTFF